jgi:hypothetical protein
VVYLVPLVDLNGWCLVDSPFSILGPSRFLLSCRAFLLTLKTVVNIYALCLPPRSKLSTSSPAEAAARHHGKQTLRASGLDESQSQQRSKLRGMNPVAIQNHKNAIRSRV